MITRTGLLLMMLAVVGVFAAWYMLFLMPPSPSDSPHRSERFTEQLSVTISAIDRYKLSGASAAQVDHEFDVLMSLAHSPYEWNALYVVSNYHIAAAKSLLELRAIGRVQKETMDTLIRVSSEAHQL